MSFCWYVVQTYPNAEAAAERRLNRQLFATHLPRRTIRTVRRGRVAELQRPCFSGYLFVLLDIDSGNWQPAASTRGILRILPHSDMPIAVPTREVIELHEAELGGALVSGAIRPGKRLKVWRGALARQVVKCLAVDDERGLVSALFQCFNREIKTTLQIDQVTAI